MKKLIILPIMLVVLLATVCLTGCVSPGGGGTGGNGTNILSGQALTNTAILVQTTVRTALILVIDKNGTNALAWTAAARDTLSLFLGGTNYSPGALQASLSKIPVKELKSVEAQLAISTILGAYQIYYQDYVATQINGNDVAVVLLTAIRDGLSDAVSMSSGSLTQAQKARLVAKPPTLARPKHSG